MKSYESGRLTPFVTVPKENVLDILPTTDFQALCVAGSLSHSRWQLNHFVLSGWGYPDLNRLEEATNLLVQHFPILRTIFTFSGNKCLQVILKNVDVKLDVYKTEDDLNNFIAELQKDDMHDPPRFNSLLFRVAIIMHQQSLQHSLVVRLSHAQYDGVCLTHFWESFQAIYQGNRPSGRSSFVDYVFESTAANESRAYSHWTRFLEGSSVIEIAPNRRHAAKFSEQRICGPRDIILPCGYLEDITPATVVKAAWALVLRTVYSQMDVVFAHVIAGRNISLRDIEKVMGPCLNLIPVRVVFDQTWKASDLLHHIQEQQVANIPFETLGFREILSNCVSWGPSPHFSSAVQHQNIDWQTQVTFGDIQYGITGVQEGPDMGLVDVLVFSAPSGDTLQITIKYLRESITHEFAEILLDMLYQAILAIYAHPSQLVGSISQALQPGPRILQQEWSAPAKPEPPAESTKSASNELLGIVEPLWNEVLCSGMSSTGEGGHNKKTFFELGGDLVTAAQLCYLLQQRGISITIDDLFHHSTLQELLALVSSLGHEAS
jgi:hypothetical protein